MSAVQQSSSSAFSTSSSASMSARRRAASAVPSSAAAEEAEAEGAGLVENPQLEFIDPNVSMLIDDIPRPSRLCAMSVPLPRRPGERRLVLLLAAQGSASSPRTLMWEEVPPGCWRLRASAVRTRDDER